MRETDDMRQDIHSEQPTRATRARLVMTAAVVSGVLVAGCGGSSPSATTGGGASATGSAAANAGAATTSASRSPGSSQSPAQPGQTLLNFARCMRANGVPNFPDPKPGGGFRFPASPAPAFAAAKAKCQKLLPNGGAPPQFDPQALGQLRQIAICMRRHGVPDFPDPVRAPTTGPSGLPGGGGLITDYRGVQLQFPTTLDLHSPAFQQAATACGGGFLKGL
jgi:hypothetical protein